MRHAGHSALLVALWLLAWGELTLANVMSGVVVAAVLLVEFPPHRPTSDHLRLRPLGVARLTGYVARQLVLSNLVMAREILRRSTGARPGVLAHRLQRPSEEVVTIMTSIIALSPGTMTVDVDRDSSSIYVHFFLLDDVDAARAGLIRLEELAVGAVGAATKAPMTGRTKEAP
jgi:multicomponent Na+:H+ antiporter subunit E